MSLVLALFTACSSPADKPAVPAGPEPVAFVVVFEGNWGWIGNELYDPTNNDVLVGAYLPLRVALDAAFAELPRGSQTAIVSYGMSPNVLAPLGPVERASSAALGPQSTYLPNLGSDLVTGITAGIDVLAKSPLRRKVLVVIGDGMHFDETGSARLRELRAIAARHQITTSAIVVPWLASETPIIDAWTDDVANIARWSLVTQLRFIALTKV